MCHWIVSKEESEGGEGGRCTRGSGCNRSYSYHCQKMCICHWIVRMCITASCLEGGRKGGKG